MVSRLLTKNPLGISLHLLLRFSKCQFKEIANKYDIFKRAKYNYLHGKKIITFDSSFYETVVLRSESLNVYIEISHLLCLYILSQDVCSSLELTKVIENLIFPNKNYGTFSKKRNLGEISNIVNDCNLNECEFSKNIIIELKKKSEMLRDLYWYIEEEQIYLDYPQLLHTIKNCTYSIQNLENRIDTTFSIQKNKRNNHYSLSRVKDIDYSTLEDKLYALFPDY